MTLIGAILASYFGLLFQMLPLGGIRVGGGGGGGSITLNPSIINSDRINSGTGFAATPSAGEFLALTVNFDSGIDTVTGVTCTGATCTWVHPAGCLSRAGSAGESSDVWYVQSAPVGVTGIAVTLSSGANYQAAVYRMVGVNASAPMDGSCALLNETTSANPTGAPITSTTPKDVIISTIVTADAITGIYAGNIFTSDVVDVSGGGHAHYVVPSGTGTYTPQWADAVSAAHAGTTVAFRP